MNASNIKAITLGGQRVIRLSVGGVTIWEEPSEWEYPVKNGSVLTISQVYSAAKNNNILTIDGGAD